MKTSHSRKCSGAGWGGAYVFLATTVIGIAAGCSQERVDYNMATGVPKPNQVLFMLTDYESVAFVDYASGTGPNLPESVDSKRWEKIKSQILQSKPIELDASLEQNGKLIVKMKSGEQLGIYVYADGDRQVWSPDWLRHPEVDKPIYFVTRPEEKLIVHSKNISDDPEPE